MKMCQKLCLNHFSSEETLNLRFKNVQNLGKNLITAPIPCRKVTRKKPLHSNCGLIEVIIVTLWPTQMSLWLLRAKLLQDKTSIVPQQSLPKEC